ncbi:alpha-galactosidase [Arthrobacter yangruifuii]|uniref:Alpha-galactosidase n=1 Tax=Arthrobacter yangruifuii TaxID=2606616 RepID=A0A5N6MV59_9MICC|nr:alpha-glucosidase/alpha-galactosidase [Arthrobacter yangruifuii]KAD4060191.1 alpha-galactosidase [Arthrobacter yangruifuii]
MTRITFIGAGSVVFTRQLLADLYRYPDLRGLDIVLHDIDRDRLAVAEGIARQLNERFGAGSAIRATTDRREALTGTDFAINMIQVGGIEATQKDLLIPARYGLRQTIGDTTGIGGVFRGLRTFPVLSGILEDIRQVSPDAVFLNYTNPMAMNITWAQTVAPDIRSFGLCHSVYWTAHDLADLVGVPLEETTYRAAGLNHQAWLLDWKHDGEDLYPRLRERIAADPELQRRVRVEMFRRLGAYPTETSEHSSEYLPWFLRSDEQIRKYRLQPLEYLGISEANVAEFKSVQAALLEGREVEIEDGASEYAPQIIHSIVTGTPREVHVNVANDGLLDQYPAGLAVEVPARVDASGVHPVPMKSVPLHLAALNRPYASVVQLTVEAAATGNPDLVRQAVLMDPNASSTLTPAEIWALCNEMVQAHGDLLPEALRIQLPADEL